MPPPASNSIIICRKIIQAQRKSRSTQEREEKKKHDVIELTKPKGWVLLVWFLWNKNNRRDFGNPILCLAHHRINSLC